MELYDENYVESATYKVKERARELEVDNIDLKNQIEILKNQLSNEQSVVNSLEDKIMGLES